MPESCEDKFEALRAPHAHFHSIQLRQGGEALPEQERTVAAIYTGTRRFRATPRITRSYAATKWLRSYCLTRSRATAPIRSRSAGSFAASKIFLVRSALSPFRKSKPFSPSRSTSRAAGISL